MATDNRGVMVYLPSEVEVKMTEYCTEHNITRKDKQGSIVTSLGSGIVAYLKSQLLSDIPRSVSDRPIAGLTRAEVLDLIAESNASNTPLIGVASLAENRSSLPIDADVLHRLEMVEQKLSSSTDIARHEVEELIQKSEQKILDAARKMSIELSEECAEVQTIKDRVNAPPLALSNTNNAKAIEDIVKSAATHTRAASGTADSKPMSKDIRRWLEPLKDKKFSDIIQTGISENLSNQEIVTRLFVAGYGKNENTQAYPANLASAMKTAWGRSHLSDCEGMN